MMKTIMHKGKLLHHHAPSGFYIDLAAAVEFAARLERAIPEKKRLWDDFIAGNGKYPTTDGHRLLVYRSNKIILEDQTEKEYGYAFGECKGGYWASNVEVNFSDSQFGHDHEALHGLHRNWRERIGGRISYSFPWCKTPLSVNGPMVSDWFPMSACYSPARIALENMK